jgi:cytosine/adenosine deaminase-related metal-dependent hydrolase
MIILARKILPITSPDIDNGALLIKKNLIKDIGPQKTILRKYPDERVVDLEGKLIMPGLMNLHTHLELSWLKGIIGEKPDFIDWVFELVELRKNELKNRAEECAADGLREAIRTGTTCIADTSSRDISLQYLVISGIRANVYLEVLGMDESHATDILKALRIRLEGIKALPDRLKVGISPHAPYSVSVSLFHKLSVFCSKNRLNSSIHVSETKDESLYLQGKPSGMDGYMKRFGWDVLKPNRGRTPVSFLNKYKLLNNGIAVHSVHVNSRDISLLKSAGASVAHCPRSNHYLNAGTAPVGDMIDAGVNVGIGTDSLASNLDLDMWEEMRFAYLVNRLPARKIFEMATINGAKALGLGEITGSLEAGKEADIIAITTTTSTLKDPYHRLLLDTRKGDISLTMVQGKAIYSKDGQTCHEF